MAKYGKKASDKVEKAMHEKKKGTLKSGSGKRVTSKKQAIAIGLSEASRRQGAEQKVRVEEEVEQGLGSGKKNRLRKPGALTKNLVAPKITKVQSADRIE